MSIKNVKILGKESILIFTMCSSILICIIMARFAIIPQIKMVLDKYQQYKSISGLISSEAGLAKICGEIKSKNQLLKGKVDAFYGQSSETTHDISGFLETLIDKAKISDIRFVKMVPQEESHNQDFTLSPIVLDFTTSYNSLGQFVSAIERTPQMYRINRLYIEAKGEGKVDVKLMITCFIPLQEKS